MGYTDKCDASRRLIAELPRSISCGPWKKQKYAPLRRQIIHQTGSTGMMNGRDRSYLTIASTP